jgi:hypothetical protein
VLAAAGENAERHDLERLHGRDSRPVLERGWVLGADGAGAAALVALAVAAGSKAVSDDTATGLHVQRLFGQGYVVVSLILQLNLNSYVVS